jgi:formimidoylglutamate deiminase
MQREKPHLLFARTALTHEGWQRDVVVSIDASGHIAALEPSGKKPEGAAVFDLLLPGIANVHSHAFQRAMAGLTETASGAGQDNFWSWRQVMYHFTKRLTPEHIEIIARHFYIELLKQGYTAVGEFHYLHHDAAGKPYAARTELSDRIIAAAQSAGIYLTHMPVLYETANFGGVGPHEGQRRFIHALGDYLSLLEALRKRQHAGMRLGVAPHSLRAVTPDSLQALVKALPGMGIGDCPIHIHVAEQQKEVDDCLSWSGKRPVEWLLAHAPVGPQWCLIHATHATEDEIRHMAASGAVAGLCPTTEANLGDGIFPAEAYLRSGGRFGIGSDSNVCVSPWEEMRQMEYVQRLTTRRRNVLHGDGMASVGRTLFTRTASGGAQALGMNSGVIAPGCRADMVALATDTPLLSGKQGDQLLDTLVFASAAAAITHVWVGGECVIEHGAHRLEQESASQWRAVLKEIAA